MHNKQTSDQTNDRSLDAFLFHQGTHFRAYSYLGCSVKKSSQGYVYVFRTWAPGAEHISVVGDFSDWQNGLPMSRITDGGIWELSFFSEISMLARRTSFASPRRREFISRETRMPAPQRVVTTGLR